MLFCMSCTTFHIFPLANHYAFSLLLGVHDEWLSTGDLTWTDLVPGRDFNIQHAEGPYWLGFRGQPRTLHLFLDTLSKIHFLPINSLSKVDVGMNCLSILPVTKHQLTERRTPPVTTSSHDFSCLLSLPRLREDK